MTGDPWCALIGAGLAAGGRWLAGAGLLVAGAALLVLHDGCCAGAAARLGVSVVAACGAIQAYLALRMELDRRLFEAMAGCGTDLAANLDAFDDAMSATILRRARPDRRPMADRVRGLAGLVRWSGILLAVQFALLVAAVWVAP